MRAALATACVCAATAASTAAAHGRFPATTAVRAGDDGTLLVATTFGLVASRDLARWDRW